MFLKVQWHYLFLACHFPKGILGTVIQDNYKQIQEVGHHLVFEDVEAGKR